MRGRQKEPAERAPVAQVGDCCAPLVLLRLLLLLLLCKHRRPIRRQAVHYRRRQKGVEQALRVDAGAVGSASDSAGAGESAHAGSRPLLHLSAAAPQTVVLGHLLVGGNSCERGRRIVSSCHAGSGAAREP